jgi:hypothetical protein
MLWIMRNISCTAIHTVPTMKALCSYWLSEFLKAMPYRRLAQNEIKKIDKNFSPFFEDKKL